MCFILNHGITFYIMFDLFLKHLDYIRLVKENYFVLMASRFLVYKYHFFLLFFKVCFFLSLTILLSFLILFLYKLISTKNIYIDTIDKVSGFECGFEPFSETRSRYFVKFFIVGLLFLLFDLEIVLLLPLTYYYNEYFSIVEIFWVLNFGFFLLNLGLFYEYKKNILEWF